MPDEAHTSEINLGFLDEQTSLPRQNFSARWRGFFFVPRAQTIEFFAGGNDEVELRVDGELLLTRSLREGMRTVGRRITLEAGAHEIAVDYQQFGGGMALNIQRALEGQQPAPFSPAELFSQRVDSRQVLLLNAARSVRRITPYLWLGLFVLTDRQRLGSEFQHMAHEGGAADRTRLRHAGLVLRRSRIARAQPSSFCWERTRYFRTTPPSSQFRSENWQRRDS